MQNFKLNQNKKLLLSTTEFSLLTDTTIASKTLNQKNLTDLSVIEIVDQLINNAVNRRASDIHLEPYNDFYRIRFRIDGFLVDDTQISSDLAIRIIIRLKILANLNIAEKRQPQDGFVIIQQTSIRLNICPLFLGEKAVLRIVDSKHFDYKIDNLGLTDIQLSHIIQTLNQANGLILIAGPTGSGKSATLHACLAHLKNKPLNIVSIEDPIEKLLTGINQVNVNEEIGLDFPTILRAFLRQDPDVIMIGEIRDKKTAQLAISAAQTGHLVLASIHTNYALDVLNRFIFFEVDPHFLSVITMIVAQRLIRKYCQNCFNNKEQSNHACVDCIEGYSGRVGIFEILLMNDEVIKLWHENQLNQIQYKKLWQVGMELVKQNITDAKEIKRVLTN